MEYTWILALGFIFGGIASFGIGANDVANSFATSIGSKSLTYKQACLIAIFTELLGAILMGANTVKTVKGGILKDLEIYENKPEIMMLGMMCALVGMGAWLLIATRLGWPVSTTHSVIGSVLGVGIATFGYNGINWGYNGVLKIVISWFISPIMSGIIAASIYTLNKVFILRKDNSVERGLKAIPLYVGFTVLVCSLYVLFKGPQTKNVETYITLPIALGISILCIIYSQFVYKKWLKRRLSNEDMKLRHLLWLPKERQVKTEVDTPDSAQTTGVDVDVELVLPKSIINIMDNVFNKEIADYKPERYTHHTDTEKFDNKTEYLYSYLQVLTASFASFAHGSNDVANSIGPLSTIYTIWSGTDVTELSKTNVEVWMLLYGGIFIDLGLILYGYKIMRTLGNNMTYHSPSRGFAMELGTALTVVTASKLGIPVSTTHCITGATVAVGLCSGHKAVKWSVVSWTVLSWVLTLPITGLISGSILLFGINSPQLK